MDIKQIYDRLLIKLVVVLEGKRKRIFIAFAMFYATAFYILHLYKLSCGIEYGMYSGDIAVDIIFILTYLRVNKITKILNTLLQIK